MIRAQRPSRRSRWTAVIVTGVAGILLGGAVAGPAVASGRPAAGRSDQAAGVAGAPRVRPSADPVPGVPNPIAELPEGTSPNAPLSAADKDLVVKVRLAGLWEQPASEMAVRKGASKRVREIGAKIGPQHKKLDELCRAAAARLGVALPNEPNADQRGWLDEMRAATGPEFDRIYVDRLRAAHGKIFPAIGTVRSATRNDVVRELAAEANAFVLTHLTLLESTGLVDYNSLPQAPNPAPPAPGAVAADSARNSSLVGSTGPLPGGVSPAVMWIVLGVAVVAGAYSMVRLIRPR
jgi:predicted outer membrane protein